ncbi:unnamed protein product [Urochloa decumbens]|uniref:WRKY domain-containing protein n=1 Tax=Urochloa decumbens TaxID=240449 RepID=A0ABC9AZJ9_9POAL
MAAAWCMPAAADERERAVAEVAQVYERIKIQQPLLQVHHHSSSHQQLAQSLLSDALRALNVALSVMKQQRPSPAPATTPPITSSVVVKAESPRSPSASADSEAIANPTERRPKKRRSSVMEGNNKTSSSSWVDFTTVPYEDGYEWRKYGEKKINGTSYTRSYFRCTYKDDAGCLATKHVQQKDSSSDPPVFQVTYNNKHTCNNGKLILPFMNIKLEPPVLPPNTLAVQAYSALHDPFDQTMPPSQQEPSSLPVSMQQPCGAATSSTTTSSCISGAESCCDEFPVLDMAQMAAAAEASPGYDLLYEELSLLCDSFKFY